MKLIHKSMLDFFGIFLILYILFQVAFWRIIRYPEPEECLSQISEGGCKGKIDPRPGLNTCPCRRPGPCFPGNAPSAQ